MYNEENIIKYIKANLKENRFLHTLGVSDTAVLLAKHYGAHEYKAKIAGLLHDCAKNMKIDELLNIVNKDGNNLDEVILKNPALLHGIVGAIIAREKLQVEDEEILNAITYHTTGKKDMTLLEKIIYLADYIEPSRNFPGVEELRKLSLENLDVALLKAFDNTIVHVISNSQLLHKDTVEARNFILEEITR